MIFQLTEEQDIMQKMVRDFAQQEVKPAVEQIEKEDQFPSQLMQKMGKLGLMGIQVPDGYGGSGMDFTSYIIAIHELAKVNAAVAVLLSVHSSVGTHPILDFGTREQKDKYLPKLASGEYLGAFALTEPGAGSDAVNVKTRAKKDHEGSYILNGSKVFITNGGKADTYITFARTSGGKGSKGISAFILERGTPGFMLGKQENKMGLHGSSTVSLSFEQCQVPEEQLLGQEGQGFEIAMANLNRGRIGIAAQALGIGEAALEYAKEYAGERYQFNRPIATQQGISFKLAEMATDVEAAKLLTYQAAHLVEQGVHCPKEASMAKLFASRMARQTAIEAVQIYGGYGYTKDYPVERLFRDAKVTEIYEGTSEIQRIVIAKELIH